MSGEFGVGWTSNTNKEFYFDLDDYDKIKNICWSEAYRSKDYSYVRGIVNLGNSKYKNMSFVVTGKDCMDHIDRNPFNNKKSNLRIASCAQNNMNCTIQKNNKTGIIGVFLVKDNKWRVKITINGKEVSLGYFDNFTNAIIARLEAERTYYKEFAPQRHLFSLYLGEGSLLNKIEGKG